MTDKKSHPERKNAASAERYKQYKKARNKSRQKQVYVADEKRWVRLSQEGIGDR